ncbi:non-ribosomal peptide synthetase [Streptomyces africanus]|uniref:non-ribosomal peptide synthetase n=1 Tax=Streptomyces africanus TaxID=231024 RepID=UPI000A380C10|nr:non-ribosomal peptide synthetase [Streptomyces africanus]
MIESFIDFFEAHVAATPDATAIVSATGTLSYHELDALARRQALELIDRGVQPGALVGVYAAPGSAMIAAILGVLKAGAAYVPLDPEYPEQRLDYLVEDSGMSAVLAEEHRAPRLSGRGLPVIGVPSSAEAGSAPAVETVRRGPDDLVYVIYTSGSTGLPKGVRVTEANVVNLLNAVGESYKLSESDVTIFTHSFTFDASVLEIFAPLAFGAKLVVAAAEERRDAAKLVAAVKRHGVTIWDMVPAMLAQVVDLPDFAVDCASLRLAISGADVLPPGLAHRFLTLAPWCELQNQYGPTEATVITTIWPCTTDTAAGPVPIGFPIAGTSVHILDDRLAPVEPGKIGEIHIGGAGVTAGYHGRPELTAERFVTDPDGVRLYRTGDLGRLRADGALEFHGRADRQLAVRGFRVEPGEIEDALCADPAVQNAAVVTRGSGNDVLLVAYVTPSADGSLLVPALRARVGEILPEHLRPNVYVVLDKLPLGISGKVDHRVLPAPPSTRPELSVPYVAPGDQDEQKVAATVAQTLGLDDIGVDDNFFELGAHSLLVTKIITRVRAEFQTDIPVSVVFEHPTVAGLVGWLRVNADAATKVQGPTRADRTGPIPLSLPQEQVWFLGKLVPDSIAYATQAYLDLRGPVSVAVLEESLGEIVRRHELLRTTFVEGADGMPEQIIHPPFPVSVQVEDLSGEPEEIREILALDRMQTIVARPFDVGRLPLFRWVLFRLSADHHMLLLVEHHFIHDGWSFGVLMQELRECYRAFDAGGRPRLPELPVQFADYAVWQRQWLAGDDAERQWEFWREKLRGAEELLPLPTDRPRPQVQSHHGDVVVMPVPADLYRSIRLLGASTGATGYMVMTAIFTMLMNQYSGRTDMTIAISMANRRFESTERLIGMMINGGLLRADLSGDPTFGELRARITEAALDIYRNQDFPFSKLVEYLNPERNLAYNPLYQVAFSYHDARVPQMSLGDTPAQIHYLQNYSAKHDLDVIVIPRGEQLATVPGSDPADEVLMEWIYSTDLFDRPTIAAMAEEFVELCRRVVDSPDKTLSELVGRAAADPSA